MAHKFSVRSKAGIMVKDGFKSTVVMYFIRNASAKKGKLSLK